MRFFSLTDFGEREKGGRRKWQFVSQGLFRLFLPPPKTYKLTPPALVTENSWDRKNVVSKSGCLRTPGFRRAEAAGRCPPTPTAPARCSVPPVAAPAPVRVRAEPASACLCGGAGGAPVQGSVSEGPVPSHHHWARPVDAVPTEGPRLTSRGRPEGESSWESAEKNERRRPDPGDGLGRGVPPRALVAQLRDASPQQHPAGTGHLRRGAGVSFGRGIPRMECNGNWDKWTGHRTARLVGWTGSSFLSFLKTFLKRLNLAEDGPRAAGGGADAGSRPSGPAPPREHRHPPWGQSPAQGGSAERPPAREPRLIYAEGGACAGPGAAARPLKSWRLPLSSFLFSLAGPFV